MKKEPYVMVMVSDMSRSIKFYRDVLALKLRSESPEWTEFDAGGVTLALHGGGIKGATKSSRKNSDLAGACSLGFVVGDLDRTFRQLSSKGVVFTMKPMERKEEGIKLAVCLDPDGMPISLSLHHSSTRSS